ncbi:MAG: FAD-binding oxidoreductase [Solivirus sp.]|uniref:FAD-binding oxidoreductase n=1 Tax=Solivirus sp. TaxID=2487772 RepID=A0A3G5AJ84_9VIRU|nr:MAG: FAD-binding oxidoreductase [Solivirus sp.]
MSILNVTTLELWPIKSAEILKERGVDPEKLKESFSNILFPWDKTYDQQRVLFSSQNSERPLFIIKAQSIDEVVETLNILKRYSLTLRIVGGRHSTLLQDPDLFLDISNFNTIKVDKYLKAGSGATQGQINDFLFNLSSNNVFLGAKPNHPTSLAFPGGSAASVGAAGISTVGGIGTLRRTLGLAVDSIRSFKIVIPSTEKEGAELVKASKRENPDLFWALRGGLGSNFGVVIEIEYYLKSVGEVILYEVNFDFESAERVLTKWQRTAPRRPKEFNEDLAIFYSDGEFGINITGVYVIPENQKEREARRVIRGELESLEGEITINKASSYASVYNLFVEQRVYHNYSVGKTILTKYAIPSYILVEQIKRAAGIKGRAYLGLQLMGGEISAVASNETAYYPREAKFFVDIFSFWDNILYQQENFKWNNETFERIYRENGPYVYLGFPIPYLKEHLSAYYGRNKERLLSIKKQVDPLNLLRFPGSL